MRKIYIMPDVIGQMNITHDEESMIRYENLMICMSTSPILSLAAILTYYFQSTLSINPVTERIAASLILIGLAMVMEISSRILKTQRLAQHIQTITLSTALFFIILEFYSVFGPAVWTLATCLAVLAMMRTKKVCW